MFKILLWFFFIVPVLSSNNSYLENFGTVSVVENLIKQLLQLNSDSSCIKDIQKFLDSIDKEKEEWAKKMFDSMEKFPFGIMDGRMNFLGNFDECLQAKAPNFIGQHCMVEIIFKQDTKPLMPMISKFIKFFYGVCLPSTCTAGDIEDIVDMMQLPEEVSVQVKEKNCWTDDPIVLSTNDWIIISFLTFVFLTAICSTIFDIFHQKDLIKSSRYELYSSFSLDKNWKKLISVYKGSGNIGCLHGIRTLTMCWVVLGHEYVIPLFGPALNTAVVSEYMLDKKNIPMTNAFVSVDTFFLLSGLLVTLVFFRDATKKGGYDVPVSIIHRYLRITPAYAVMVWIQATIAEKLGRGPMWNTSVGSGVEICQQHWWEGLIYLQNFLAPNSSCLGQSWYLSSDMQMFWVSPVFLYPLLLWPKLGLIFYFCCLGIALATNFTVAYINELGPQIMSNVENQFSIDYVQTYMRITPYIVGIGLAYIICGMKSNKIRVNLSKSTIIIGWLLSTGLCLGSLYTIAYFYNKELADLRWQAPFYLAFHRLTWSLGLSWVIFACIAGYGGIINTILSCDIFQFFGKVSYCIFLVHFNIQLTKIGLLRTNYYIEHFNIVTNYFSTLVLSFFFSIPLYLLFEAPFGNLDKYFLQDLSILQFPKRKTKMEPLEVQQQQIENGLVNKSFVE